MFGRRTSPWDHTLPRGRLHIPLLSSCETLGRLRTLFHLSFLFLLLDFSDLSPSCAAPQHPQDWYIDGLLCCCSAPLSRCPTAPFPVPGDFATRHPSASFVERPCKLPWCTLCFDFPWLFCLHSASPNSPQNLPPAAPAPTGVQPLSAPTVQVQPLPLPPLDE